jgi:hypothetical protein
MTKGQQSRVSVLDIILSNSSSQLYKPSSSLMHHSGIQKRRHLTNVVEEDVHPTRLFAIMDNKKKNNKNNNNNNNNNKNNSDPCLDPQQQPSQDLNKDHATSDNLYGVFEMRQHSAPGFRRVNFACTECRKAHKACSGGRPCERCEKLGLQDRCVSTVRKKRILTKKYWGNLFQLKQSDTLKSSSNQSDPAASISSISNINTATITNSMNNNVAATSTSTVTANLPVINNNNKSLINNTSNINNNNNNNYVNAGNVQMSPLSSTLPSPPAISPRNYSVQKIIPLAPLQDSYGDNIQQVPSTSQTSPRYLNMQPQQSPRQYQAQQPQYSTQSPISSFPILPNPINTGSDLEHESLIEPRRPSFSLENYKIDNTMYTTNSFTTGTTRSLPSVSPRSLPSMSPRSIPTSSPRSMLSPRDYTEYVASPRSLTSNSPKETTLLQSIPNSYNSPRQFPLSQCQQTGTLPPFSKMDSDLSELSSFRNLHIQSPRSASSTPRGGPPLPNNGNLPQPSPRNGTNGSAAQQSPRTIQQQQQQQHLARINPHIASNRLIH